MESISRHKMVLLLMCLFLAAGALVYLGEKHGMRRAYRAGITLAVLVTAAMGISSFLAWLEQSE
jgi:hypothetical protein